MHESLDEMCATACTCAKALAVDAPAERRRPRTVPLVEALARSLTSSRSMPIWDRLHGARVPLARLHLVLNADRSHPCGGSKKVRDNFCEFSGGLDVHYSSSQQILKVNSLKVCLMPNAPVHPWLFQDFHIAILTLWPPEERREHP